ncbi:hypothetical protein [Streptomyces sp. A1547]|uniref:hypothetical protein n=1 Tax=Streptomyces sp. A1547 TaxID=2563105 RepID=UPI00109EC0E9|nr:hypothetical protein [Streptomyces sp. A1547]THA28468.1 hypothetical protein E6W17_40980 [Streptomyces sp. A1547]
MRDLPSAPTPEYGAPYLPISSTTRRTPVTVFNAAQAQHLLQVGGQIPDVIGALDQALEDNGDSIEDAADVPGLEELWADAEPESRAAVLLGTAWLTRKGPFWPTDPEEENDMAGDPAWMLAEELHQYALDFTGGAEDWHGARFPAMPLPGPAGALSSSSAFDRDDNPVTLRAAMYLLAPVRRRPLAYDQ